MPTCNVLGETQEHKKSPAPGESGAPAHATSDPNNVAATWRRRAEKSRVHSYVGKFRQSFVVSRTENLRLLTQKSPERAEEHGEPCSGYCGPSKKLRKWSFRHLRKSSSYATDCMSIFCPAMDALMPKAHLVILSEENEPVIRAQCSSCPEVVFVVDRTAESCLRIVHDMFDAHFERVHKREG